ncbi:Chemotaxis regulator-transmits chemoreceptor signals to flagelllar motor components CheY [Pseudoalteromonas luteoviolacea B = ATCC 29581]|nr:Chemotaxis regulator-transmits chemoreceptor signals to flagelllar motor components CheY [Pseudoalteromonas luteoviolacea B = ATCC 29581]
MRILVVDDMPLMRHVLINMLRRLDFSDITEATDGQQALQLLKSKPFDLVISDLYMPKISGKELVKAIRQDPVLSNMPIVIVTCEDEKSTIQALISEKINGFIVKPFCLTTLEKQLAYIKAKQL